MKKQDLQIEIIPYKKEYGTVEDISKIFFRNYRTQKNIRSFKGVYLSLKAKHGAFTYIILAISVLGFFFLSLLAFTKFFRWHWTDRLILSFIGTLFLNYLVYFKILSTRIYNIVLYHGDNMIKNFKNIEEKYIKNGGNFWIALINDTKTGKKKIIGHLGCNKIEARDPKAKDQDVKPAKIGNIELFSVDSEYRGLGIGKRLIEQAIVFGETQKFSSLTLGLSSINIVGINIFQKYGFKIVKAFEVDRLTGLRVYKMEKILS